MDHRRTTILATVGVLFAAPTAAEALYTHTGSSTTDVIYLGCRSGVAVICDDGVLTTLETSCTLTDDVVINASGGNDTVTIVRSSVAPSCNGSSASITAVTYNGHYVDVVAGSGTDTITGGTGDHALSGGDDGDYVKLYSSVGFASGDGGADTVLSGSTGNGWEGYGGSYDDCVAVGDSDPFTTPNVLDCGGNGANGDNYVDVSGFSELNCEHTTNSCGS